MQDGSLIQLATRVHLQISRVRVFSCNIWQEIRHVCIHAALLRRDAEIIRYSFVHFRNIDVAVNVQINTIAYTAFALLVAPCLTWRMAIPLSHFWISATCCENKYFYLVSLLEITRGQLLKGPHGIQLLGGLKWDLWELVLRWPVGI